MNKFQDTANRLLGIDDEWGVDDIGEHLQWLMDNPDEIADGYDKSTFKHEYYQEIMDWVKKVGRLENNSYL